MHDDATTSGKSGRAGRPSRVERFLGLFTDIRPGEGSTALILLLSVMLILIAYYFVKPARDGWLSISAVKDFSKLEVRAISGFGQSLVLLLAVPLYARLTDRLHRRRLITGVNLFFASNLLVFWLLQPGLLFKTVPFAGIAFFLWGGIFAVLVVAQFWAFAADLYTEADGLRLFPLVAVGASSGAVVGSWLAGLVVRLGLESFDLLLVAPFPLVAAVLLLRLADRRGPLGRGGGAGGRKAASTDGDRAGAFRLVLRHRYLLAVAVLVLLFNWVVTNGDNVLFGAVQDSLLRAATADGLVGEEIERFIRNSTTVFYGDLYFWVNLCGFLLQAFLASRLLKYGGIASVLLMLPAVAFISYTAMALVPLIGLIKVMKIAESSTNYSINNTARHVLWLPTTREMKYKAKVTVDTLFARLGDGFAAATVLVGVRIFSASHQQLFVFNLVLIVAWVGAAFVILRERKRLPSDTES